MTLRYLLPARQEIDAAVEWYAVQAEGLAGEFIAELDRAARRVVAYPAAYAEIDPGIRRCLLAKFPYGFIYALVDGEIVVVAVAHLHRAPRYWADRA